MTKRFFVTGTDTEVGKTIASSALLQAANLLGFHTAGYKPVASGSELTGDGLRNEDALALQRHSRVALRYDQVNPYTFAEPDLPAHHQRRRRAADRRGQALQRAA
ncbi:dithiobiotin synthetase [Klebsiella pneumoniae]|uniref:Dithiobiotin synthetase n=1 Tax=Klebsiella pneumoniae TaxID=573 RepID=A0A2X3EUK3_KLEPN|nr:dithiobiotin synthetase [Klebsiella pneumoniae]